MRRHSRRHRSRDGGPEFNSTAVFITPMLDMAFQLMTFFVFTYHPSALEGQYPISLAVGAEGGPKDPVKKDQVASPITNTPPDLIVEAYAVLGNNPGGLPKGALARLVIRLQTQVDVLQVADGSETVPQYEAKLADRLERLSMKLAEHKKQLPREDRMQFEGGYNLRWDETMRILDHCRKTKVNNRDVILFPKVEMTHLKLRPGNPG